MLEALAQRQAHAAENRFLRHGQHWTRMAANSAHEIVHRLLELSLRHEAIHHAEFQRALCRHRVTRQNKFKRDLRSDEERQNSGSERREDADADFRLGKPGLRGGNHEIAEGRQLRAAADRRSVHNAYNRLADFQHSREGRVKRIEHLKHTLRRVFTDIDSAAKDFAGRIENDQLNFLALAGMSDSPGDFAEHRFIEKIMYRTVEGDPRDACVDAELHMLKLFRVAPFRLRREFLGVDRLIHFPRSWAFVALMT